MTPPQLARAARLRDIAAKAAALADNITDPVADLEFQKAVRAEYGDGKGFEAAWEDACHETGWNEDFGDYDANLRADARFDRSRRIDLMIAMGAR